MSQGALYPFKNPAENDVRAPREESARAAFPSSSSTAGSMLSPTFLAQNVDSSGFLKAF